MPEKRNYKYDPEEEEEAGYASLWDVLMGFTSPAKRPWVRIPGQRPHSMHIVTLHEIVHCNLFSFTTVGNIQQFLSLVLMEQDLDEELQGRIEDMLKFSIHTTRFVHDGCATYTSMLQAKLFGPTVSASDIQAVPAYYVGAMEFFDDYLKPILVSEESKIVLNQAVTRFALSPNIYELFKNFWDISSKWNDVLSTILNRCVKLLSIFSDKVISKSFAIDYERFVRSLHGGKVNKTSPDEAALQELFWLFRFFKSQLPELDIFPPDRIPESALIAKAWERQLRSKGIKTDKIAPEIVTREDVETSVVVRPPQDNLQVKNMIRMPSPEWLRNFEPNAAIFTQLYIHRETAPFVFEEAEKVYVQRGEAYARLHLASISTGNEIFVNWHNIHFYTIETWPKVVETLLPIDGPLTWLCLWEEELDECVSSGIIEKLKQFTNPVVGLVCSNDLRSLESLIAKWGETIEGITSIELMDCEPLFIIINIPMYKLLLVAPTVRATEALLCKRLLGEAGWSTMNPLGWGKEELRQKWCVLLYGIAGWAF